VRATSHVRVGGRAEVSVRGRVEVRRGQGRARVRRAPAGPLRLNMNGGGAEVARRAGCSFRFFFARLE